MERRERRDSAETKTFELKDIRPGGGVERRGELIETCYCDGRLGLLPESVRVHV